MTVIWLVGSTIRLQKERRPALLQFPGPSVRGSGSSPMHKIESSVLHRSVTKSKNDMNDFFNMRVRVNIMDSI
jgi:hypothetical protein